MLYAKQCGQAGRDRHGFLWVACPITMPPPGHLRERTHIREPMQALLQLSDVARRRASKAPAVRTLWAIRQNLDAGERSLVARLPMSGTPIAGAGRGLINLIAG